LLNLHEEIESDIRRTAVHRTHYADFNVAGTRAPALLEYVEPCTDECWPVQKPWNGEVPYDVLVWIDSDMVFRSRDVLDLIEVTEQYPVVSGLNMLENRQHVCAIEKFDTDYFVRNGHFEALTATRTRTPRARAQTRQSRASTSRRSSWYRCCEK
jgi:hypothetical protein